MHKIFKHKYKKKTIAGSPLKHFEIFGKIFLEKKKKEKENPN